MISPFTIYPNEKLVTVSIASSSAAQLSDLGKVIILAMNTLYVSNANLTYRYCSEVLHLSGVSLDEFRRELSSLAAGGYLQMLECSSAAVCTIGKIYRIACRGQEFLRSKGKLPQKTGYAAQLDAAGVKKLLSVQQAAIPYFRPGNSVKFAAPILETRTQNVGGHIFRTHALIQESGRTTLMESVRSTDGVADLLEKLRRINDTLTGSRYLNEELASDTELLLVCTDDAVLSAVTAALRNNRAHYCFRISGVTDQQTFRGDNVCYSPIYKPFSIFLRFPWKS